MLGKQPRKYTENTTFNGLDRSNQIYTSNLNKKAMHNKKVARLETYLGPWLVGGSKKDIEVS